jgi:hypothetical protein
LVSLGTGSGAMTHYVRTYDPITDIEEWVGPVTARMANWITNGLEGLCQTRIYQKSELSDMGSRLMKLIDEYRESMDRDVLHSWAKDVRVEIRGLPVRDLTDHASIERDMIMFGESAVQSDLDEVEK